MLAAKIAANAATVLLKRRMRRILIVRNRLAVRDDLGSSGSGAGTGDSSTIGSAGTERSGEVSVGADMLVGSHTTGRLKCEV